MLSNKLTCSLATLIVLLMIGFALPVMAQTLPIPTFGTGDTEGQIPPGGFLVLTNTGDGDTSPTDTNGISSDTKSVDLDNMPDLEAFFSTGGTIEIIVTTADGDDATTGMQLDDAFGIAGQKAKKPAYKDLVISEIMWGLDRGITTMDNKQWIEIYNSTDVTITIDDATAVASDLAADPAVPGEVTVSLKFTANTHQVTPSKDLAVTTDRVGNLGTGGRFAMPGSSGVSVLTTQVNAPLQSNLVSAYRNIDYKKVMGFHKLKADNTVDTAENRKEQLKGIPDGGEAGSWKATPAAGNRNMARWHIGSPGEQHVRDTQFTFAITRTSIPSNSVVINEIRNSGVAGEDWVELYNAGTTAVGLRDWELSAIKSSDQDATTKSWMKTDKRLVGKDKDDDDTKRFPPNDQFKLKAGEYLLIVERHPSETSLANGVNIEEVIAGNNVNAGAMHQYIVRDTLDLDKVKMLILRNALDKNSYHNKDDSGRNYKESLAPSEKIMDYAGAGSFAVATDFYNTEVWPFRGWTKLSDTEGIPSGNAFARLKYEADLSYHKDHWDNIESKGGIGYDPGVNMRNAPGTPGYANDSMRNALVDDKNTAATTDDVIFHGDISISEVMVDAGPRWNLVQWIELYNSSMTEVINLKDWELEIRNATDEVESYVDSGFDFNDAYILPNQTLLLVSGQAVNDVADNRVYNLNQHHRRQLGLTNRRSVLLSPGGFYLKLADKNGDMVDEAGNVMVKGAARNVAWELPARSPDMRRSLVRQYGSRELYDGTPDMADGGTMMESWRQSDLDGAGIAFYGHRDDVGTPGYRLGGPLPVQLSKFRPARDENTGHVVVRWITESELNNAGFNILRSESKTGEFKVVNVKGIIAGHGTTSEKHVYEWTDTTAKPNVVYYYQIEDVSLNGHRTTLTTTRLKGHISASGKLTTRWSELKSTR